MTLTISLYHSFAMVVEVEVQLFYVQEEAQ
jgi:hypothetical protein